MEIIIITILSCLAIEPASLQAIALRLMHLGLRIWSLVNGIISSVFSTLRPIENSMSMVCKNDHLLRASYLILTPLSNGISEKISNLIANFLMGRSMKYVLGIVLLVVDSSSNGTGEISIG